MGMLNNQPESSMLVSDQRRFPCHTVEASDMLEDGRPPSHKIPKFPANKWLKTQPSATPSLSKQHANPSREISSPIDDPSFGGTQRMAIPITGHRRPLPRKRPSSAPSTPTSASLITFPLFNATIRSLVPDLSEAVSGLNSLNRRNFYGLV